jgi:hypothetical protein
MKNRKPGELIETAFDFWLGMAGAAAKGFSDFSAWRREDKVKEGATPDIFTRASQALVVAAEEAQKVASSAKRELDEKDPARAD